MKRGIDYFFIKQNAAVPIAPVAGPERPDTDPPSLAEVTSPPVSPAPGPI